MTIVDKLKPRLAVSGRTILSGVPEGLDALAMADIARALGHQPLLHIARDDQRLSAMAEALGFFVPDIELVTFPAWDCLPYDRVSPVGEVLARRLAALARLAQPIKAPLIILTNVNAALQRI